MSITNIKKHNSFNLDSDSIRSLDYINFKMVYPNDIIK